MHGTRTKRRWRTLIAAFLLSALGAAMAQAQTWEAVYGDAVEGGRRGVIPVSDDPTVCGNPDGYISVGWSNMTGDDDVFVVRTDMNGATVWESTYDITAEQYADYGRAIWPLRNNPDYPDKITGYVITGFTLYVSPDGTGNGTTDVFILEIDCNGAVVWSRTYGNEERNEGGHDIIVTTTGDGSTTNPGDIAVCGWAVTDYGYDGYILRTDRTGNILWDGTYNVAGLQVSDEILFALTELTPRPDERTGDLIAVGSTFYPDVDPVPQAWAHRVNGDNGNLVSSAKYGDQELQNAFFSVIELEDPNAVDPESGLPNVAIVGSHRGDNYIYLVQLNGGDPNNPRVENVIGLDNSFEYGLDLKEITFDPTRYDPETPAAQWDLALCGFYWNPDVDDPGDAHIVITDKDCNIKLGQRYTANAPGAGRDEGWSLYPVDPANFSDATTYGFIMCGESSSWDPLDLYLVKTRSDLTTGDPDNPCSLPYDPLCERIDTRVKLKPIRERIERYYPRDPRRAEWSTWREVCDLTATKGVIRPNAGFSATPLDLSAVPNPVRSGNDVMLHIAPKAGQLFSLVLANSLGETVATYENRISDGSGYVPVSTDGLAAGVYNVTLRSGEEPVTVRVVVVE